MRGRRTWLWLAALLLIVGAPGTLFAEEEAEVSAADQPSEVEQTAQATDEAAAEGEGGGEEEFAGPGREGGDDPEKDDVQSDVGLAGAIGLPTQAENKAWQVNASASVRVGSSTFLENANARQTLVNLRVGAGASYQIPVIDTLVSLSGGFSQWLSRAGGTQEPQEFRFGDMFLSLSRPIGQIPWVDILVIGNLTFTIPTSTASRQSDLITTFNPALTFLKRIGAVSLTYTIDYTKNFNLYTSTTYDPTDVDVLSRENGNEVLANDVVAAGGVLTEHVLYNIFGLNYAFLDSFLFSVRFGFADFWSYDNGTITEDDEFASPYADTARGHSQVNVGVLRLTYNPTPNLSTAFFVTSQQPWKTDDNKSFRFPFFDFQTPGNSYTFVGMSIAGFY